MFCKKCGAEIADNAAFCPKCGERVNQVPPAGNPYPNKNYQQPYGGNPYGYNNGYHRPASSGRAPGMIALIVAGILVLIGGIAVLGTDMKAMSYVKYLGGGIAGALVFEIILGIVMIVAGICSLIFCNKKEKGNMVFALGVIVVVMRIIDWILASALFGGYISVITAGGVILGLICPALIAVGGYLNKKA